MFESCCLHKLFFSIRAQANLSLFKTALTIFELVLVGSIYSHCTVFATSGNTNSELFRLNNAFAFSQTQQSKTDQIWQK